MNVLALPLTRLSNEEEVLVVDVSDPFVTEFNESHLETYKTNRNPASFPNIYGKSRKPEWLNYKETILIKVSDILGYEEQNTQGARMRDNPEAEAITNRIATVGFELFKFGIYVTPHDIIPNKYRIIEGRTRFNSLVGMGMNNIIGEVFVSYDDNIAIPLRFTPEYELPLSSTNCLRFGVYCNSSKDVHSKASFSDWKGATVQLAKNYKIDNPFAGEKATEAERTDFINAMSDELQYMSDNSITDSNIQKITSSLLNSWQGTPETRSFPDGKGINDMIEELVGIDEMAKDAKKGIFYVPTTNDPFHISRNVVRACEKLEKDGKKVNELRLIAYVGRLNVNDPAKDWKDKVLKFKNTVESFNERVSKRLYHSVKTDYSTVKLYGVVPMVYKLEDKYPMDKIVEYTK